MISAKALAAIFAAVVAAAGWFYMFYSRAAQKLSEAEGAVTNVYRVRLRRANGLAMFLLAVCIFAGVWTFDEPRKTPGAFLLVWFTAILLLFVIVALALMDLRLTQKLRRRRRADPPPRTLL